MVNLINQLAVTKLSTDMHIPAKVHDHGYKDILGNCWTMPAT